MIFSVSIYVIIYVIKMSDDEAVDIAVAVEKCLAYIFLGKLQKPQKSYKIIVATAVSVDLTNYESSCTFYFNLGP